jgi:hypothetical protein
VFFDLGRNIGRGRKPASYQLPLARGNAILTSGTVVAFDKQD